MRQVLLLNGNGDVLNFIPWTRALTLVLKGRVTVYETFEDEVRSQSRTFRIPAVVGLMKMVPFKHCGTVTLNKTNLLIRDGYECQYCGHELRPHTTTIDHVVPTSRGGKREWLNCVAACKPCNGRKDNRTPEEAHMPLRGRTWVPTRKIVLKEHARIMGVPQWMPYFA
jgi:5-methylcytosine-specific restriction endonuclease McrA